MADETEPGAFGRIEKGVPLPARESPHAAQRREALLALAAADIGDSVLLPTDWFVTPERRAAAAGTSCLKVAGPGWFSVRAVNKGVRVWKVAEPLGKGGAA